MRCDRCKFWREPFATKEGTKGHCRLNPPIAVVVKGQEGETDEVIWTQPLTAAGDYCFQCKEQ